MGTTEVVLCDILLGLILLIIYIKRSRYDKEVLGKVVDVQGTCHNDETKYEKRFVIEYKVGEGRIRIPLVTSRNTWHKIHKGSNVRVRYKSDNPYKYIIVNDPNIFAIRVVLILAILLVTVFGF